MGRSSFNVPEGVIRDKVAWFAVIYQFESEQVLVAKPTPRWRRRELQHRDAAPGRRAAGTSVRGTRSRELGRRSHRQPAIAPARHSREPHRCRPRTQPGQLRRKHQAHLLLPVPEAGAGRQQGSAPLSPERAVPAQAIRDTLPILLGVSSHDRYELEAKLRIAQRDLRLNAKLLEQARDAIDTSHEKAIGLHSEAKAVGVIGRHRPRPQRRRDHRGLEITALSWKPENVPEDDGEPNFASRRRTGQVAQGPPRSTGQDRRSPPVRQQRWRLRKRGRRTGGPAGLDQGAAEEPGYRRVAMAV